LLASQSSHARDSRVRVSANGALSNSVRALTTVAS
jgi:hypothetical protein